MRNKYLGGIRLRFLLIFFISIIFATISALTINNILRNRRTDYSKEIQNFNRRCSPIFSEIKENMNNKKELQNIIDKNSSNKDIYIVNKNGEVLLKQQNNCEKQLDIDKLLKIKSQDNYFSRGNKGIFFDGKEIKYYNIEKLDENRYIVASVFLVMGDDSITFILLIIIFIVVFLLLTYGRIKYIDNLSKGLKEISKGNLDYRVQIKGKDELALLGKNINYMTEELKIAKEKEKQIKKNKDMLIVSVSHDLRTPLTSIVGYVKLLKEKYKGKDDISRYIDIMDNKSHRLEELINDLFEYTKLTSYDIKLEKTNISLNEFIRQVVEGMMSTCNQNNLNIFLEAPDKEVIVNVDPMKMMRVFENIITNAIRYSDKAGNIKVKISQHKDGAIVSIENEGKSIRKEELDKIFDRFYRTDEARSSETGGSGIGLSIAKSIVELHHGEIWAECEENKVCFFVLIKGQDN
ncbi:HAMP domain-containing sensor histidine kinase [Clostridium lundense]|uniref:HAMP domain-containing sensor histidine kinase n=1 Tax=Clostridium lundense TaxID=319475 RepID=UPI000684207A|nr:ATP-binding protein [Clostridium lundense]